MGVYSRGKLVGNTQDYLEERKRRQRPSAGESGYVYLNVGLII